MRDRFNYAQLVRLQNRFSERACKMYSIEYQKPIECLKMSALYVKTDFIDAIIQHGNIEKKFTVKKKFYTMSDYTFNLYLLGQSKNIVRLQDEAKEKKEFIEKLEKKKVNKSVINFIKQNQK